MTGLIRLGGLAAIIGGGLRIGAALIPYTPNSAWLEALYGIIDIGLMLGLIATYLTLAPRLARTGLTGFVTALIGIASIIGPDAPAFGIDFYRLGALVLLGGLAIMAVAMVRSGAWTAVAGTWLLSVALVVWGAATGWPFAITLSGGLLGAGFVLSGRSILRMGSLAGDGS